MTPAELKAAIDDQANRILVDLAKAMQPYLDEMEQRPDRAFTGPLLSAAMMAYGRCLSLEMDPQGQKATEALTLEYIKRMREQG
jgi:hypothetical protein